jgi:hypothetical protein
MLLTSYLNAKNLSLLFRFYLNFCLVAALMTLVSIAMLYELGPGAVAIIVWFKIITMAIFTWYVSANKHKEFFYYRNLGLSKFRLFACTLGFDLIVFVLLMVLTHIVRDTYFGS